MQAIRHKRGDTLGWRATGTDSDPDRDLTGVTVACQIRKTDSLRTLVATLDCSEPEVTDNVAVSNITATAPSQAAWPFGDHECDVKWSLGGEVFRTETFRVSILREVTE
jgi:hypothetical protein